MATIADIIASKGMTPPVIPAQPAVRPQPPKRKKRMWEGVAKHLANEQNKRQTRMAVACQYAFLFGSTRARV